ncbi:clathrin heavy chain linker domain-containing protein 1 isoform X3 [Eublepharis macularius]|uniref:Clathrin heavy chain linker domain-containing protein 1 n=1 Tax=Eublepharis macularius TaxID=481883 RepID=A0AA97JQ56_EUBMA|nr:clathrin heavy chain linker domain-containing protein 1 isoform X3 [Eublepharis macularius]
MCLKGIKKIERNSTRTENLIKKIRTFRTTAAVETTTPCKKLDPSKAIPGLSHKDSFNMDALAKHLAHLQKRLQELKEDMFTKYVPVENMAVIEEKLNHALNRRDKSEAENKKLKSCYYRIVQFANALSIWENTDKSIDTLNQLIVQIRERDKKIEKGSLVSSGSSIFERDHTQATEAADMIEYIERFNELFSRGQYESAAIFAANCPRGILRNEETMEKFKAVSSVKGKILPLLMYCEALVSTSMAVKHPLPANLTVEAIKCALSEKRLELVMYWITQQKLSFNEEAGDVICAYGEVDKHNRSQCLALAQIAYSRCGAHKKAALCLCKQGQISGAMDYIHQLQYFSTDDYIYLVKNCPSVQLIRCLTQEWKGKPAALSLGATVLFLYNTEQRIYSIRLLEDIAKESRNILEQMIINDSNCNVEEWKEIAEICFQHKKIKLGKLLISILTAQDGVLELPPDDDSAKLMEHVFM